MNRRNLIKNATAALLGTAVATGNPTNDSTSTLGTGATFRFPAVPPPPAGASRELIGIMDALRRADRFEFAASIETGRVGLRHWPEALTAPEWPAELTTAFRDLEGCDPSDDGPGAFGGYEIFESDYEAKLLERAKESIQAASPEEEDEDEKPTRKGPRTKEDALASLIAVRAFIDLIEGHALKIKSDIAAGFTQASELAEIRKGLVELLAV